MAAAKGNQYAVKLKTDDLKKQAYKDYCKHIASGKSKEGWRFKDDKKLLCTHKTIENYIKECPEDFPPIHKELAESDSFRLWEAKGVSMMDGKINAEPALYQMFMRNKFGWDKKDSSGDDNSPKSEDLLLKEKYYAALYRIQELEKANDPKCKASQIVHGSDAPVQPVDRSGELGEDVRVP